MIANRKTVLWVLSLAFLGACTSDIASRSTLDTDPTPVAGTPKVTPTVGPTANPLDCGNGALDAGEQCDGANLPGQNCASLNPDFESGTLSCTAACQYSYSNCVAKQTSVVIDTVSDDTITHHQTVTISGSGLGTKTQAAPMQFDDFEEGVNGAALTTTSGTNGWTEIAASTGSPSEFPRYNRDAAHSGGLGTHARFDPPVYNSSFNLYAPAKFRYGMYLDAWLRYFRPANDTRSWKPWDMYGSSDGQGFGNPVIDWFGTCDGSLTFAGYTDIASPSGFSRSMNATLDTFTGSMHHLQIWAKPNTPTGASNGVIEILVDGTEVLAHDDMMFIGAGSTNTWARLALGFYMSHDQQGQPGCISPVGTGGAMYWDDVYIDNTAARVELGNHPIYSECTHREIQIPTAWSDGSITFEVNRGSFAADDQAYLFVVNSNGMKSVGYPVTVQ